MRFLRSSYLNIVNLLRQVKSTNFSRGGVRAGELSLKTLCRINLKKKRAAAQIAAKNKRVESLDELEFHQVINTIDPGARKSDHHSIASVFCKFVMGKNVGGHEIIILLNRFI